CDTGYRKPQHLSQLCSIACRAIGKCRGAVKTPEVDVLTGSEEWHVSFHIRDFMRRRLAIQTSQHKAALTLSVSRCGDDVLAVGRNIIGCSWRADHAKSGKQRLRVAGIEFNHL